MPLLERGWAAVHCHVRGGNEMGESWAAAARGRHKHVSFEDVEVRMNLRCFVWFQSSDIRRACIIWSMWVCLHTASFQLWGRVQVLI